MGILHRCVLVMLDMAYIPIEHLSSVFITRHGKSVLVVREIAENTVKTFYESEFC